MAAKMETLITNAKAFMKKCQSSDESNMHLVNEATAGLNSILPKEKEALAKVRSELQEDNNNFKASIYARIIQLTETLVTENDLMDEIVVDTTTVKVYQAKLAQSDKEIKDLRSERAVVKSGVGDVNAFLSNILDSHDPILTISIRKHLADKFLPAIDMLSMIKGVSETPVIPKQGEIHQRSLQPHQLLQSSQLLL